MLLLIILTAGALLVSLASSPSKTWAGIKKGSAMFLRLLPLLLLMLAAVSFVLYLIPDEALIRYMGRGSGLKGWLIAALLGSVALIPGYIAFPLCRVLIKSGVAYATIAVFITTLMMVGIFTLPVEAKFFGWRTSLVRNGLSFLAAIVIGFLMGLVL